MKIKRYLIRQIKLVKVFLEEFPGRGRTRVLFYYFIYFLSQKLCLRPLGCCAPLNLIKVCDCVGSGSSGTFRRKNQKGSGSKQGCSFSFKQNQSENLVLLVGNQRLHILKMQKASQEIVSIFMRFYFDVVHQWSG